MNTERIAQALKLAYRQETALNRLLNAVRHPFAGGFSCKKIIALLLTIAECMGCILFDTPVSPQGKTLDLTGYSLVFEDEFQGDTLDTDAWFYRGDEPERCGFEAPSQIAVRDDDLVITGEYREDGKYGAGWYAGEIALNKLYARGYFECRCKCSESTDYWSAFWIQSPIGPYDHDISQGGVNGAEIDIFEAMSADEILPWNRNAVTTTIHCNGWDEDRENIDSRCLGVFRADNIYKQYNTYGLEWTEDEYIFYINGVETARSAFGNGVSQIPEMVILSLCLPSEMNQPTDYKTQFFVDYVKIYQKDNGIIVDK